MYGVFLIRDQSILVSYPTMSVYPTVIFLPAFSTTSWSLYSRVVGMPDNWAHEEAPVYGVPESTE